MSIFQDTVLPVRIKKQISDTRLREEFIRSANSDAVSKRFVSDELSSKVRNGFSGDSGRNMRRESGSELQTDSGKSQNNQDRVLSENADHGRLNDTHSKIGGNSGISGRGVLKNSKSPFIPIVHSFVDISGVTRNIQRINGEFKI